MVFESSAAKQAQPEYHPHRSSAEGRFGFKGLVSLGPHAFGSEKAPGVFWR